MRSKGVLSPVIVRRSSQGYVLVAGERRWRAAQKAGLRELPVMVREVTEKEAFELALIENIQREDLNPVEEAEAFRRLIDEHGLTQEALAARVGKDRSTVANALRLLRLPDAIKQAIVTGELSMGHARALLAIADEGDLRKAAEKVMAEGLSVRAAEALVQRLKSKRLPRQEREASASAQVKHLVEKLQRKLGAKVELKDKGGSGTLEIRYATLQELDRVLAAILGE
ncbi:MAG: ParB/RepB/Spo0J family partition protein [Deltaproteobacteria bacterium]